MRKIPCHPKRKYISLIKIFTDQLYVSDKLAMAKLISNVDCVEAI